jgi:hypothetical protein
MRRPVPGLLDLPWGVIAVGCGKAANLYSISHKSCATSRLLKDFRVSTFHAFSVQVPSSADQSHDPASSTSTEPSQHAVQANCAGLWPIWSIEIVLCFQPQRIAMPSMSDVYLASAAQSRREASQSTLANVRERCLRSAAAWQAMGERAKLIENPP